MDAPCVPMLLQAVLSTLIACWAIRLGSFLVMRVMKTGGDSRFDEAKHQPLTFFVYWTMQVRGGHSSGAGNLHTTCTVAVD